MPIPGQPGAASGMPPAAAPPADAATGAGTGGPTPSPISTPQPMQGLEKAGRAKMQVISKSIGAVVNDFPFGSKEQKALIDVMKKLADTFGKTADDDQGLMKSETLSMLGLLGNKTPGQAAMGGAKPPGAPGMPPGGAPAPAPQGA